ncbi:sugar O-acetyltransferase [Plastorhodobacter daqingensis]|uniref:Sugar O-acetyltransferase n=1 Tax=Plastorhodobacter daqingensis TaxID=1387281 RepID=A0ABW2UJB1_9RHOB
MDSEKARMLAGAPYRADDPELAAERARAEAFLQQINTGPPAQRPALLGQLLGTMGEGAVIRPPFHCDYGYNIRLGADVFLNFGCVILDVAEVSIGAATQIGPGVQILTADHPRDPSRRRAGLESGRPVQIGENVWIGGGALLLPGVHVGAEAIIGAGAVVTRDVAAGSTVAGNPARPLAPGRV